MPKDPTRAQLFRLNQNIMTLGRAIEEISICAARRKSNARGNTGND